MVRRDGANMARKTDPWWSIRTRCETSYISKTIVEHTYWQRARTAEAAVLAAKFAYPRIVEVLSVVEGRQP